MRSIGYTCLSMQFRNKEATFQVGIRLWNKKSRDTPAWNNEMKKDNWSLLRRKYFKKKENKRSEKTRAACPLWLSGETQTGYKRSSEGNVEMGECRHLQIQTEHRWWMGWQRLEKLLLLRLYRCVDVSTLRRLTIHTAAVIRQKGSLCQTQHCDTQKSPGQW